MDIRLKLQSLKQLCDKFMDLDREYMTNPNLSEVVGAQLQVLELIHEGILELDKNPLLGEEEKIYKEVKEFWHGKDFHLRQLERAIIDAEKTN